MFITFSVSLVKTDRPIEFNNYVQPIAIERGPIRRNSQATFAGHGAVANNSTIIMSEYLQYINLQTISEFECRNRVNYLFVTGQIRALPFIRDNICTIASANGGICSGDSGSGLIINDKLVGVASFILDPPLCANGFPEFFTRISSFANWIDYHTQNV
jgi:secreted trypsin-like serine protease